MFQDPNFKMSIFQFHESGPKRFRGFLGTSPKGLVVRLSASAAVICYRKFQVNK